MKKVFIFFLLVIVTLTFIWANTDKRPLTVDDSLNIITVRDVQLSPDGTRGQKIALNGLQMGKQSFSMLLIYL